jgi:uncharacterized protein
MTLVEQINDGIKEAMKSRDSIRLNTLRMLKSKILAVDARSNLPDSEVVKLFKTYLGNLEESVEQFKAANRSEAVTDLEMEIGIVKEFLPQALSPQEIEKIVQQAITDSGGKTKKELGLVMKRIMQLNSSVDGKLAKELAAQLLLD